MMRSKQAARLRATAIIAATIGLVAGCLRSTEPQPSLLSLGGTWTYIGVQSGPVRENMSGTLTISAGSGVAFQGRLDLIATNQQTGQSRLLGGVVSGTEASSTVVDFDASLETSPRRHVGQLVADTMSGTWVGNSPDGVTATGTFRAVREQR